MVALVEMLDLVVGLLVYELTRALLLDIQLGTYPTGLQAQMAQIDIRTKLNPFRPVDIHGHLPDTMVNSTAGRVNVIPY